MKAIANIKNKKNKTRNKTRNKPHKEYLKDGTICYTKPVRYPSIILKELKKLWYENDFKNMSEVIFHCIEQHDKNKLLSEEKPFISKENVKSLTVRFREHHYEYILKVCQAKGLDKFTDGVLHILYEYLNIEGV